MQCAKDGDFLVKDFVPDCGTLRGWLDICNWLGEFRSDLFNSRFETYMAAVVDDEQFKKCHRGVDDGVMVFEK